MPPAWLRKETLDRAAGEVAWLTSGCARTRCTRRSGGFPAGTSSACSSDALEAGPRVLLLNDFTRGVDVKAKAGIHALVRKLADAGIGVCVTSSDLEELLGVADRIVCMRAGRIVADGPSSDFDKLSLLALASTAPARGQSDQAPRRCAIKERPWA